MAVEGDKLLGYSPMSLPGRCVKCGKDTSRGGRVEKTLYGYSPWIILTVFLGVLPLLLVYYLTRQRLQISYSVCEDCARSRTTRQWAAGGVWVLFVLLLAAGLAAALPAALWILTLVVFVGALVASSLAAAPLRVTGVNGSRFTIKGAGQEFLAALSGPRTR